MNLLDKVFSQVEFGKEIHSGEAYILWTQLQARYDTLELAQYFFQQAKDSDFKALLDHGIKNVITPQIKTLEKLMNHYKIPVTERPPVDMNLRMKNTETTRDEHMFRIIFAGSQTALLVHVKGINICINDALRNTFMDFLSKELHMYDNLVKYGKLKGWVHVPPAYITS